MSSPASLSCSTPNLRIAFALAGLLGVPALLGVRLSGASDPAVIAMTVVGCAAATAVFLLGGARMRVVADPRGVVVVNLLRVTRVGWDQVRGFALDPVFPYIARLELADGGDVRLWGISDEPLLRWGRHGRHAETAVDALNAAFRRALIGTAPAPGLEAAPPAADRLGVTTEA